MSDFKQYRRKEIAELRPWIPGEDLIDISVSAEDAKAGSPKPGDMIARNPKNHDDKWLIAAQYFADNFAALSAQLQPDAVEAEEVGWTGKKCPDCGGVGQVYCEATDNDDACPSCGGTGDEYDPSPKVAPPLAPAARMRRALEFYACAENYERQHVRLPCGCCSDWEEAKIVTDEGAVAREALSRADEGKESGGVLTGSLAKDVAAAAKRVSEWSAAKQDYARRATGSPSDPTPAERVPGLNWELSEETKKHLAEIDRSIVRPGDPRMNTIICGPQSNPVQDAEPVSGAHVAGRTGGANPPTGATPAEQREAWPSGCRNPNSCSIHRDCMYLQCKHYERDISGEVDAALSTRAGG